MKTTKAFYEMGCDDKAFIVFLFSEKEFCELCVDLVRHAEGGPL
jgi:hypothetical protein